MSRRAMRYLQRYENLLTEAERLNDERNYLLNIAKGTKAMALKADIVQASVGGDLLADAVIRYTAIEQEIEEALLRSVEARHEIEQTVRAIKDTRLSDVLYYRYIRLIPLHSVGDYMRKPNGKRYSYQHIRRLHADGIKAVDDILAEKTP
jgi:hypothetical protein